MSHPELTVPTPRRWRPRWRKMTWALWAWVILIVVWVIGVGTSAHTEANRQCAHETYKALCRSASEAGSTIGAGFLIVVGVLGFIALSLVWMMTRPRTPRA